MYVCATRARTLNKNLVCVVELLTPCYGDGKTPYTPKYPSYSEMEVFNPTNEDVFNFMKSLIGEIKTVFKDSYIHLGMDEVNYGCW